MAPQDNRPTGAERQASHLPTGSLEVRIAWYAGSLSVVLAVAALLPALPLRALAVVVGGAAALALAPLYLRRATVFSAALVTVGAALWSTATVIGLSGLPWRTGISWSRAGGVGQPSAWLFTTTCLCFGAGVLATGRLLVTEGRRRGDLNGHATWFASLLPVLSFAGFLVVALCPVGGAPILAAAHNIASWAALGSFFFGMVASLWVRGLSRALRYYSGVAAVLVFGTWLPNGLRFMRLITARPISMLVMEMVVFPLCLSWFCWLAWEWSTADGAGCRPCLGNTPPMHEPRAMQLPSESREARVTCYAASWKG